MAEHHFTWLTQGEFHMLIQVGGAFRGMHVLNQNPGNNADLIRHSGAGNRVRFTYTEEGHRMYVEVGGSWMGLHVSGGDPGDNVKLIRYEGDGHLVRPVRNENGTWKLLIKVGEEWKGLHVHQQNPNDRASLVRHSGGGNDIVLSKATIVGKVIEEGYLLIDVGGEWKGLHAPVGATEWKGVHVRSQDSGDTATLIRHSGNGNGFLFIDTPRKIAPKTVAPPGRRGRRARRSGGAR